MYDSKYMIEACNEAQTSIDSHSGGPFGCVIVKDGQIVGRGHNQVLSTNDPTCHGEISAIRDACDNLKTFDLTGCELYTTGEPCGMCLYACFWANIDIVYYGCSVSDNGTIGFRDDFFDQKTNLNRQDLKSGKRKFLEQYDQSMCLEVFKRYQREYHKLY